MPNILIAETVDENVLQLDAAAKQAKVVNDPSLIPEQSESGIITFYYKPLISIEGMKKEAAFYDAILVRPKEVDAGVIANADRLKLIIRGGAGVNSIALDAAQEKNIVVENTPGLNSTATAEFTFNLLFDLVARRHIERSVIDTRRNAMKDPLEYSGVELEGKKIAIIGLGNIGKRMVVRAKAFGMEVFAYSRSKKDDVNCFQSDNLKDVLANDVDIISLHLPLCDATHGMINNDVFPLCKKGVVLLNTARPQLVDVNAFKTALEGGVLASAGIDGDYDVVKPFVDADPEGRCVITHHIADATYEAQQKITRQMLSQVFAFFNEEKYINRVV
jgi:D-3-phosphoglycerate dehydrogenase